MIRQIGLARPDLGPAEPPERRGQPIDALVAEPEVQHDPGGVGIELQGGLEPVAGQGRLAAGEQRAALLEQARDVIGVRARIGGRGRRGERDRGADHHDDRGTRGHGQRLL